jgi:hypothetical protein
MTQKEYPNRVALGAGPTRQNRNNMDSLRDYTSSLEGLCRLLGEAEQVVLSGGGRPGNDDEYTYGASVYVIPEPTPIAPGGIQTVYPGQCSSWPDTNATYRLPGTTILNLLRSADVPLDGSLNHSPPGDSSIFFAHVMTSSATDGAEMAGEIVFPQEQIQTPDSTSSRNRGDVIYSDGKPTRPCHGKFHDGQWDERFRDLMSFREEHGHLFVPHSYPANQKLAQWVKRYVRICLVYASQSTIGPPCRRRVTRVLLYVNFDL